MDRRTTSRHAACKQTQEWNRMDKIHAWKVIQGQGSSRVLRGHPRSFGITSCSKKRRDLLLFHDQRPLAHLSVRQRRALATTSFLSCLFTVILATTLFFGCLFTVILVTTLFLGCLFTVILATTLFLGCLFTVTLATTSFLGCCKTHSVSLYIYRIGVCPFVFQSVRAP
jgi:hypothetical protein